jgi:hypothetical protein
MPSRVGLQSYDAVVVGGGPAGIYVASHYALTGGRVCVVEIASTLGGSWRFQESAQGVPVQHSFQVRFSGTIVDRLFERLTGSRAPKTALPPSGVAGRVFRSMSLSDAIGLAPLLLHFAFVNSSTQTVEDVIRSGRFSARFSEVLLLLSRILEGPASTASFNSLLELGGVYGLAQRHAQSSPRSWSALAASLTSAGAQVILSDGASLVVRGDGNVWTVVLASGKSIQAQKVFLCIPPTALYRLLAASGIHGAFGATLGWSRNASFLWRNATVQLAGRIRTPAGDWWAPTVAAAIAADVGALYGERRSRVVISWMNREVDRDACVEEVMGILRVYNGSLPATVSVSSTIVDDEIFVGAYSNQLVPSDPEKCPNAYVAGCYTSRAERVTLAETAMLGARAALLAAGERLAPEPGEPNYLRAAIFAVCAVLVVLLVLALVVVGKLSDG